MTAASEHSDRPPRMTDVAELAGVSHQTVSRVVNGAPGIRPETRARVVAAIDRLGYRRNSAAWMLAMSRYSADAGSMGRRGVDETQHPSTETDARQAGTVGP